MKIDEIQIIPIKPNSDHVGFCSFRLNDAFYVSGIAIHTRPLGGYRLVYPSKKYGLKEQSLFYPITKEIGQLIEQKVTEKLEEVVNHDRYNRSYI